ncbi:MAG TPA: DUF58 domain-containing protein, partial [Phnomibacter sp.]|nr:DUF58 domain-containing protein [Phnomibacter sp.]
MNAPTWRQRLTYAAQFLPVRPYLVIFLLLLWVGHWWVGHQRTEEPSAMADVSQLLLTITTWALAALLGLAFLSVLVPWLIFLYHRKQGRLQVQMQHEQVAGRRQQVIQQINLLIKPLWRPLFGFLYYRVEHDEDQRSHRFALVQAQPDGLVMRGQASGWYKWPLPSVREYELQQLVVYFEDLFHFFSLAATVPVKQSFYTTPAQLPLTDSLLKPHKAQTEEIRIDELRKVEGEYLNYKNFEGNDDVRRIVWKIYAKNKELVVRIQEILDPKASHIYLYCSFYDGLGVQDSPIMQTLALDAYKNACWSLFKNLEQQGRSVKFVPDQEIATRSFNTEGQRLEYALAASHWQYTNELDSYVQPAEASVLLISPLVPAAQLQKILERLASHVQVVLVPLSDALAWNPVKHWLRWLFIAPKYTHGQNAFTNVGRLAMR